MIIAGIYSFNDGEKVVKNEYGSLYDEVRRIICSINADEYKTKKSREATMKGRLLHCPASMNNAFKNGFSKYGWTSFRQYCEYTSEYYTKAYVSNSQNISGRAYREMDFVKDRLGVEVQFGKYAFMVYNVCAKMTIFKNLGVIDAGIEIVPIKELAKGMSTGVSYFEQFVWDLEHRGIADIDIPVLILGVK